MHSSRFLDHAQEFPYDFVATEFIHSLSLHAIWEFPGTSPRRSTYWLFLWFHAWRRHIHHFSCPCYINSGNLYSTEPRSRTKPRLWKSSSKFHTFSRYCTMAPACAIFSLDFSFASIADKIRHDARRAPMTFLYATLNRFRSSTDSSMPSAATFFIASTISSYLSACARSMLNKQRIWYAYTIENKQVGIKSMQPLRHESVVSYGSGNIGMKVTATVCVHRTWWTHTWFQYIIEQWALLMLVVQIILHGS